MADLHTTLHDGTELALSNAGTPFAEHLVILCNPREVTGFVDPAPDVTAAHPVHLLVVDPLVQDGEVTVTPERHAAAIAEYVREARQTGARTGAREMRQIGIIGWGSGALVAAALVLDHGDLFGRVALVAPDLTEEPELDDPAPGGGEGPSTGTTEDRLARGVERDADMAEVTSEGSEALADRWAAWPSDVGTLLVEVDGDDAGPAIEWQLRALQQSWDRVLTHVQHTATEEDL